MVFVGSAFAFNRQSLATCAHLFQGPPRRFFSFGISISSGDWFFAASCIWDIHFDIHFDINFGQNRDIYVFLLWYPIWHRCDFNIPRGGIPPRSAASLDSEYIGDMDDVFFVPWLMTLVTNINPMILIYIYNSIYIHIYIYIYILYIHVMLYTVIFCYTHTGESTVNS